MAAVLSWVSANNFSKWMTSTTSSNLQKRATRIISTFASKIFPEYMTAANFGKISDMATKSDVALGIINMVFEVAGMLAVFAARNHNIKNIVLTGNLTKVPQSKEIFNTLNGMFDVNFVIPENSQFSTVIGAALSAE